MATLAEQDISSLSPDSPLLRKIYSAVATAVCGAEGEVNPFINMISMIDPERMSDGHDYEGMLPGTPIGKCNIAADKVWFNHDLADPIEIVVGQGPLPEKMASTPRYSSIALSADRVALKMAKSTQTRANQTKASIPFQRNRAFKIGREVAAVQGDLMMAAMFGARGSNSNVLSIHKTMYDKPGTSLADAATGKFMDFLNNLQKRAGITDANAEVVRPISRTVVKGNESDLADYGASLPSLSSVGAYSADTRLKWIDLFRAGTAIRQTGNEARGPYTMRPASIGNLMADGGKRRNMSDGKWPVWMINHKTMEYLQEDSSWVNYQEALALALGTSTGLATGNAGLYRGQLVMGFDKTPVLEDASNNKIAMNLCICAGALLLMQNNGVDPGEFGLLEKNSVMRQFMETPFPVEVKAWYPEGYRKGIMNFAAEFDFGAVAPNFNDGDDNIIRYGAACVLSATE